MRLVLDAGARRLDGGRVLLAGSPLTFFRLGPAGQRVVDAIAAGQDVPATAAQPLIDRLIDAGAAHPRPAGERFTAADVTVVIPVHGHDPSATLPHGPAGRGGGGRTTPACRRSRPAPRADVTVLRHDVNQGPAAARMTGLATVTTPLVAFVDADCAPADGWLEPLIAHFDDDRVALAAPRIVTAATPRRQRRSLATRRPAARSTSARWRAGSPRPRRVVLRAGPRRWCAVRRWRTSAGSTGRCGWARTSTWSGAWWSAGWRCRYEPRSVVAHRPRTSLAALRAPALRLRPFGRGRWTDAIPARSRRSSSGRGPREGGAWPRWATRSPARSSAWCAAARSVEPCPRSTERDELALRLAAPAWSRAASSWPRPSPGSGGRSP